MSWARSPRPVCSTTIGTRTLWEIFLLRSLINFLPFLLLGCRCLNANIRLKKINGLTQQNLFHQAVYSVVFVDFFAHFFDRNIVMCSLISDPLLDFLRGDLNFLRLGDAMEDEIGFQAMRCQ